MRPAPVASRTETFDGEAGGQYPDASMMSRRQFLATLGAGGVAAVVPLSLDRTAEKTRRVVTLWNDGGPPVIIAHLSDLHSSRTISLRHIRRCFELALEDAPDFACLTGDFVNAVAPDPVGYVEALRLLTRRIPVYACLGNHDGGRWLAQRGGPDSPDAVVEILSAAGVTVLADETREIHQHGRSFFLTGVQDLWSAEIDPRRAGFCREQAPRIVLAHNPDTKDALRNEPWELMLSGHTHGGQIRVPYYGGRLTAPVRDDRYIEGLLPWGERLLHISRGVGSLWGLRINCPPEVTTLRLV